MARTGPPPGGGGRPYPPWVIGDLACLDGIGYSGLSMLLRVRKWTRRRGGDLCLAAPQQPVPHSGSHGPDRCLLGVSQRRKGGGQHKTGPGLVPGRAAAAPCRLGYPIWPPATGTPQCLSLPGPAAAQARNAPISTSCAGCLRKSALAGRDNHGLSRLTGGLAAGSRGRRRDGGLAHSRMNTENGILLASARLRTRCPGPRRFSFGFASRG